MDSLTMSINEKIDEFLSKRKYCRECGSEYYKIDHTQKKKYYLNLETLICKNCQFIHTFDDRLSLDEFRIKIIKKIIEA